jgi:phospholipid/cholesterol/gamma-HCH transport system substrate-binding protein
MTGERNLRRTGLIGLVVTAMLVTLTVAWGGLGLLEDRYTLVADFEDVSGLQAGAPVRVAGVDVGSVAELSRDLDAGGVRVELSIERDVRISEGVSAAVALRSMLGSKYLQLEDPGRGEALGEGDTIPRERTRAPVDLDDFLGSLEGMTGDLDAEAIDLALERAGQSLEDVAPDLGVLVDDLAELGTVLAERSDDLERLLVASERLLTAVDDRRDELGVSIDRLGEVFGTLAERREDIEGLVVGLEGLSETLTPLLADNHEQLDVVVDNLGTITGVLDEQRDRLDLALGQLPVLAERFTAMTGDGPWVNVYFVGLTPLPFAMNPVLVGEDGSLPSADLDGPDDPPGADLLGSEIEFQDPESDVEPPEGYGE